MESRELFDYLKLKDWTFSGNTGGGGQAAIAEVRNSTTNKIGIFRHLKRTIEVDKKRFYRELKVLLENPHKNILTILDHTKDNEHQWYISEKGIPLETYWKRIKEQHDGEPDLIFKKAIKIILELTEGLILLHEKGVVHRDIKAKNVIVSEFTNEGVLIDFGIAFVLDEDRLTTEDDATANKMSPDPALRFMETVPPWLDVFLLSQLLIWLTGSKHNKNVQRPLDWRFVIYHKDLSAANLRTVRAITAACSDQLLSPQNARELKQFILNITTNKATENSDGTEKYNDISKIIGQGRASETLVHAEALTQMQSLVPLASKMASDLREGITAFVQEMHEETIPIKINQAGTDFDQYFQNESHNRSRFLYDHIECSIVMGEEKTVTLTLSCKIFTTIGVISNDMFKEFKNIPILVCDWRIDFPTRLNLNQKIRYFVPVSNGNFDVYGLEMNPLEKDISISKILEQIKSDLRDSEIWKAIYDQ